MCHFAYTQTHACRGKLSDTHANTNTNAQIALLCFTINIHRCNYKCYDEHNENEEESTQ